MEKINFDFNEKQYKAINSEEKNLIIIAPAGSGKTSTLVGAINKYKKDNPKNKIVAITFTVKATNDLKEKINYSDNIRVSTIHSWAYTELQNIADAIMAKDPSKCFRIKILDDEKIQEILKEICEERGLLYIKIPILFSFIMGNYNMDISASLKRVFFSIKANYIEFKKRNGLYDFTDLPEYLLTKLEEYDMNIENIDAFFVDEFQDVDDIQLKLFEKVKCTKRFYIGDPQQSIYQFRGATSDILEKLVGFKIYELDINYRSNQEILDFATTYQTGVLEGTELGKFSDLLHSYPSRVKCEKGYGGKVYSMNYRGYMNRVNNLEEPIYPNAVLKDFLKHNCMILCRTNKQVKEIQKLGYNLVSTIHQAKGLEYDRVIVSDFEIESLEDINIAYVAMTRAKTYLLVSDFGALLRLMEKNNSELRKSLF